MKNSRQNHNMEHNGNSKNKHPATLSKFFISKLYLTSDEAKRYSLD